MVPLYVYDLTLHLNLYPLRWVHGNPHLLRGLKIFQGYQSTCLSYQYNKPNIGDLSPPPYLGSCEPVSDVAS